MTADLNALWQDIREGVAGFVVFPASPEAWDGAITVRWPDQDYQAFLAVARQLGVQPLYATARSYGPCAVDGVVAAEAAMLENTDHADADDLADLTERLDALAGHRGSVGAVELAFTAGPVLHQWEARTGWFTELEAVVDELAELRRGNRQNRSTGFTGGVLFNSGSVFLTAAEAEQKRLEPQIAAAAEQAATLPGVLAARSTAERRQALIAMDPEISSWASATRDTAEGYGRQGAFYEVVERAGRLAEEEKGRRRQDALDHLDELAIDVQADAGYLDAGLAKSRQRAVRAFVGARLGFAASDIADLVYSRAQRARAEHAAVGT